jgi:apoptotic chromatin condensation inducer in the nucleus
VFVEGLVRPFTNSGLKTLLASAGGVFDDTADFWLAPIKNMAVAVFQTAEQAAATVAALNGKEWPVGQGHRLRVRHITVTDARRAIEVGSMTPAPSKAAAPAPRGGDAGGAAAAAAAAGPAKTLETLFKKTQATPRIFWLPVGKEQAARRMAQLAQAK